MECSRLSSPNILADTDCILQKTVLVSPTNCRQYISLFFYIQADLPEGHR